MDLKEHIFRLCEFVGECTERLINSNARTQYTEIDFKTVIVNANNLQGTPLGQGRCKGVRLRVNFYQPLTGSAGGPLYMYVGTARQQSWEIINNINPPGDPQPNPANSIFIPCTDLNQVFVKLPTEADGGNDDWPIEVMIYR